MVTLQKVYDNLYLVTEQLISLLKDNDKDGKYSSLLERTKPGYVLNQNGKWSVEEIACEKYHMDDSIDEYIYSLKETEILVDILQKERINSDYFHFIEPLDNIPLKSKLRLECINAGIFNFISLYLGKLNTLEFNSDIFKQCYTEFEPHLLSPNFKLTSTYTLGNFSADEDTVEFDNNIKIVCLTSTEQTHLANKMLLLAFTPRTLNTVEKAFASGFAIKIAHIVKKEDSSSSQIADEQAKHILTAFRLLKQGNPFRGFHLTEAPLFSSYGMTSGFCTPYLEAKPKTNFHLSSEDKKSVKKIWAQLNACQKNELSKLSIALTKFEEIRDRWSLEDKIIDMAILLESTLLHGIKDELSYRLSLRGANLLKQNRPSAETFAILKKFYNIRSEIVHNGKIYDRVKIIKTGKKELKFTEFINETEVLCREVLRAFVEKVAQGKSLDIICKTLDDEALSRKDLDN